MDPLIIDVFEFCRLRESLQGEVPVADLARLAEDAASSAGSIRWSLRGDIDELGRSRLVLSVAGSVQLTCQRCLTPFAFELNSDAQLAAAKDEATADHIEDSLDGDEIEVIVTAKDVNVLELVEDEALLAIPSSPRHDECPPQALVGMPKEAGKSVSAFDALKDWKR